MPAPSPCTCAPAARAGQPGDVIASATLQSGSHSLCVAALNIGPGEETLFGCYTLIWPAILAAWVTGGIAAAGGAW